MPEPVLDPLVSDGTLTSYGLLTRELHAEAGWTHCFWYGLPGLASIDLLVLAPPRRAGPVNPIA